MRKRTIIISGVLLTAMVASIWWRETLGFPSTLGEPAGARASSEESDALPRARPVLVRKEKAEIQVLPEAAEITGRLHTPETTAAEDLETLDLLLTIFRKANGGANPAGGENDEIVGQLAGKNEKSFAVLPPKHPAISSTGRLLDRWGTPYYFHPIGRSVLGLRSAGPDGKLWTGDDVVLERDDEFKAAGSF